MAPALHSSATPNEIIGKETSKLQAMGNPWPHRSSLIAGRVAGHCDRLLHPNDVRTSLAGDSPPLPVKAGSVTRRPLLERWTSRAVSGPPSTPLRQDCQTQLRRGLAFFFILLLCPWRAWRLGGSECLPPNRARQSCVIPTVHQIHTTRLKPERLVGQ